MNEKEKNELIKTRYHLQEDLSRLDVYDEKNLSLNHKELSFVAMPVLVKECKRLINIIDKQLGI